MDILTPTGYQLYVVSKNKKLNKEIRRIADERFCELKLPVEKLAEITRLYDEQVGTRINEPLKLQYKILIVLFPFFLPVYGILAGILLGNGYERKWKNYWLCISIGFVIWITIFLLFAKRISKAG